MEGPGVDPDGPLGQLLGVLVQQVLLQAQDVLALVVVDQVHGLEGGDDILLLDAGLFADLVDGDLGRLGLLGGLHLEQHLSEGRGVVS